MRYEAKDRRWGPLRLSFVIIEISFRPMGSAKTRNLFECGLYGLTTEFQPMFRMRSYAAMCCFPCTVSIKIYVDSIAGLFGDVVYIDMWQN